MRSRFCSQTICCGQTICHLLILWIVIGTLLLPLPYQPAAAARAQFQEDTPFSEYALGGYASRFSVLPGEKIDFHISTDLETYEITIRRESGRREELLKIPGLSGEQMDCLGNYATGCDWPVAHTFTVPTDWASGIYVVEIPTKESSTRRILFWVRAADPGVVSPILFLTSVNTYHAYNEFGGKSIYPYNSTDRERAYQVSFDRPFQRNGSGNFTRWEGQFVNWARSERYTMEYATTYDLAFLPDLLDPYQVVIIAGHSEYWTWSMRQRLKAFIDAGGRLINLSGNTMWWQIRYENDGRTMVAYKDYTTDPIKTQQEVTSNSWDYPVLDGEYSIHGASYAKGGLSAQGNIRYDNGYAGYAVQNTDHWIFDDTGLQPGEILGRMDKPNNSVIDHEADGTSFNCEIDGWTIRGPLANTGTPYNFTILGAAPVVRQNQLGFGTLGIYTNSQGGAVFAANATGWVRTLTPASTTAQITRNVLDRFLNQTIALPQEPTASTDTDYLFWDRFNCYDFARDWPQPAPPEWQRMPMLNYVRWQNPSAFRYDLRCGVDGSGLAITVDNQNDSVLMSQVKPNWQNSDLLYTRFYLNLLNLQLEPERTIDLLRLVDDPRFEAGTQLSALQLTKIDDEFQLRYMVGEEGSTWVPVPSDQTVRVETLWDQRNDQLGLWVDDTYVEATVPLDGFPAVNQVNIGAMNVQKNARGLICLDEFMFDDKPLPTALPAPTMTITATDLSLITTTLIYEDDSTAADEVRDVDALLEEQTDEAASLFASGNYTDAIPAYTAVAVQYQLLDELVEAAIAMGYVGNAHEQIGQIDQALFAYRNALSLAQAGNDERLTSLILEARANLFLTQARDDEAIAVYSAAIEAATSTGDLEFALRISEPYAVRLFRDGYYAEAIDAYQLVSQQYQALDEPVEAAKAMARVGNAHEALEDGESALAAYDVALAFLEDGADLELTALILQAQAHIYLAQADEMAAIATYEAALRAAADIGDDEFLIQLREEYAKRLFANRSYLPAVTAYIALGELYESQDALVDAAKAFARAGNAQEVLVDIEAARTLYDRAVTLAESGGDTELVGLILNAQEQLNEAEQAQNEAPSTNSDTNRNSGRNQQSGPPSLNRSAANQLYGEKRYAEAIPAFQALATEYQVAGQPVDAAKAIARVGNSYEALGQLDQALTTYADALAMAQRAGDVPLQLQIIRASAAIYTGQDRLELALDEYSRGIDLAQQAGEFANGARMARIKGNLYRAADQIPAAIAAYREATALAQAAGDLKLQATMVDLIGNLYNGLNQIGDAITAWSEALDLWIAAGQQTRVDATRFRLWTAYTRLDQYDNALNAAARPIGIISPSGNQTVSGDVDVTALAMHPTFLKWQLDLLLDGDENRATFIAVGWRPKWGEIHTFDSTRYPNGQHRLRLRIVRDGSNYDEYYADLTISN